MTKILIHFFVASYFWPHKIFMNFTPFDIVLFVLVLHLVKKNEFKLPKRGLLLISLLTSPLLYPLLWAPLKVGALDSTIFICQLFFGFALVFLFSDLIIDSPYFRSFITIYLFWFKIITIGFVIFAFQFVYTGIDSFLFYSMNSAHSRFVMGCGTANDAYLYIFPALLFSRLEKKHSNFVLILSLIVSFMTLSRTMIGATLIYGLISNGKKILFTCILLFPLVASNISDELIVKISRIVSFGGGEFRRGSSEADRYFMIMEAIQYVDEYKFEPLLSSYSDIPEGFSFLLHSIHNLFGSVAVNLSSIVLLFYLLLFVVWIFSCVRISMKNRTNLSLNYSLFFLILQLGYWQLHPFHTSRIYWLTFFMFALIYQKSLHYTWMSNSELKDSKVGI